MPPQSKIETLSERGAAPESAQPAKQAETMAEDLDEWKLEDALDLSDDELLDAIPDLEGKDKKQ